MILMSKFNDNYIDKQLTAALNLIAVAIGDNDLSQYPMVRDALIPHKTLANEVIASKNVDAIVLHHAAELINRLDELEKLYQGKK